ncbi:LysR family transcriptional regulator [bacterium]|nr:LysR family transcriptional regulator [bacterium]
MSRITLTLTQLEYLVALDQHRHFGKAAKACHVSQPTLSMQLQKLEADLGVVFFDRSHQPLLPTAEGEPLIAQARVVLSETRRLTTLSKEDQKELKGELRVGVIPTIAPYLVPLFVEHMARTYPKLTLNIDELQTHQILAALENESLDVGLLATPLKAEGLEEEKLFLEPFLLYSHISHPLAKRKFVSEDDLDGSDMWLLSEGHCLRSQILRFCSLRSSQPVFRNVRFEAGNLETLQRLVESGTGYTLIPWLAAQRPHPKTASLTPFKGAPPQRQVSLVWRRTQLKKRAIDALAQAILACLPSELKGMQKNKSNQSTEPLPAW